MAGFPQTKDMTTWTSLASAAVPMWLDDGKVVQDIVFSENVFLEMLKEKGRIKERDYGPSIVVPVLDQKNSTAKAWSGLDTFATQVAVGPRNVEFTLANYVVSVTVADEDRWRAAQNSDLARVELIESFFDQAILSLASIVNADLIGGNGTDSKKFLGLEQAVFAETHATADAVSASKAQARQAANVYGITRVLSGGTGWENVSLNWVSGTPGTAGVLGSSVAADQTFGWAQTGSSNQPNTAMRALDRLILLCSYGETRPDLLLMTMKPYQDLMSTGKGLQRYAATAGGGGTSADLGPARVYYGPCVVSYTEAAKASGVYSGQDAAAGSDMVYALRVDTWDFCVRRGQNFAWNGFIRAFNQFAEAGAFNLSGQLVCKNPRYNGVGFKYAATS